MFAWLQDANIFWIKALHVCFFTAWFAGLFYLPRLYVNLAMVEHKATYQHLLIMAKKLYRFITPFMVITLVLGIWLIYLTPAWLKMGWLHTKLALVSLLVIYHFICGYYLKEFIQESIQKSHIYFRWFNEFPVVLLFAIVILAVLKPF